MRRGAALSEETLEQHKPGHVVEYKGFTSTSIAEGFSFKSTRFIIQSKKGRYVGSFSPSYSESEVLFPAKTKFKVLDRKTEQGPYGETYQVIIMQEVDH